MYCFPVLGSMLPSTGKQYEAVLGSVGRVMDFPAKLVKSQRDLGFFPWCTGSQLFFNLNLYDFLLLYSSFSLLNTL